MKVWSLKVGEQKQMVEHTTQDLGSEYITKDYLEQNSDGRNYLHKFQLQKIQEQNDQIREKYLINNPNGINMVSVA